MTSGEVRTREVFEVAGTWTAIVTPFAEGPSPDVDFAALDAIVEEQVRSGVDAIVPCGTTGESPTLTHEEHDRVVEHVVRRAAGRVKVVAGTGSNSTAEALRLTRHAAEAGADGALVVCPYYNRPTQRMLFEHFRALAEGQRLPLVLYNIPARTGVNLEPETVAALRTRFPRSIVGVKEASGSVEAVARILAQCDVAVLSGDDGLTVPMMSVGAAGVVSVASNVAPKAVASLVRAARAGDFATARDLNAKLLPLFRALFAEPNPVPVKAALKILGRTSAVVRPPLLPALPETEAGVRAALASLGLAG
jgi:4-hydroxy-tetrahydrodipicolinate synthase